MTTARMVWLAAAGVILTLAARPAYAQPDLTLHAASATAGIVRADRWAPLVVRIDSARPSFEGSVVVSWGSAHVRRDVAFPSPGRRQFTVHVRTPEPESSIHLRLESAGAVIQSIDVPVRVLSPEERATLCVVPGRIETSCTATTAPDLLPTSLRGYEAIDEVVWSSPDAPLGAEQRAALDAWRAFRQLELSGDLGLAPNPVRPALDRGLPASAAGGIGVLALSYVLVLAVVAIGTARRRLGLGPVWLSIAAVVVAASGAAHAYGRIAPGRSVMVLHGSVLHQIPGSDVSLMSTHGVIEFPAYGEFSVQFPFVDGSVEPGAARQESSQSIDATGLPVLRGTHGLGSRQAFVAEGLVIEAPLAVNWREDTVMIVNRSSRTLHDCRFADGLPAPPAGTMSPGASASGRWIAGVAGPLFTCLDDSGSIGIRSADRDVQVAGTTVVAVYGSPAPSAVSAAVSGFRLRQGSRGQDSRTEESERRD